MSKTPHYTLAVLFGVFSGAIAIVVQLVMTTIIGLPVAPDVFVSAAFGGAGVFVVSVLTVLFVWPRIGFEPLDSRVRETTR